MTGSQPLLGLSVSGLAERLRAAGCVFAEDEARLILSTAGSAPEVEAMAQRRIAGEPLEYVLGWAEFCGARILVAPGVFVPRPRTEWLVRTAVDRAASAQVVLDLCTGTGAVAVAVAAALGAREVHAADVDPVAVACARRNLAGVGEVHCGDLFDPLPSRLRGAVDLLTVNAPYVPTGEIGLLPPEARDHEPLAALDGGADGLSVHRRVIEQAPRWLSPGGVAVLEMSAAQGPAAAMVAQRAGMRAEIATSEEWDATALIVRR